MTIDTDDITTTAGAIFLGTHYRNEALRALANGTEAVARSVIETVPGGQHLSHEDVTAFVTLIVRLQAYRDAVEELHDLPTCEELRAADDERIEAVALAADAANDQALLAGAQLEQALTREGLLFESEWGTGDVWTVALTDGEDVLSTIA